jgi:hypothetical protein
MTPYEQYSLRLFIHIAAELSSINALTNTRITEDMRTQYGEVALERQKKLSELISEITDHVNALKE